MGGKGVLGGGAAALALLAGLLGTGGSVATGEGEDCARAGTDVVFFCDGFDGTALDTDIWTASANGGTIQVSGGSLSLIQDSSTRFPYVRRAGTFPEDGGFTFSARFRYLAASLHGDGMSASTGLPPNGGSPGSYPGRLNVWQESPGSFRVGVTGCGTIVQTAPPNLAEHTIVWHRAADGPSTVSFDGGAERTCTAATAPAAIWLGNPVVAPNGAWTDVSFDYIRVDVPCPEHGPISGLVHPNEPATGPLEPQVHQVNCEVIAANGL